MRQKKIKFHFYAKPSPGEETVKLTVAVGEQTKTVDLAEAIDADEPDWLRQHWGKELFDDTADVEFVVDVDEVEISAGDTASYHVFDVSISTENGDVLMAGIDSFDDNDVAVDGTVIEMHDIKFMTPNIVEQPKFNDEVLLDRYDIEGHDVMGGEFSAGSIPVYSGETATTKIAIADYVSVLSEEEEAGED